MSHLPLPTWTQGSWYTGSRQVGGTEDRRDGRTTPDWSTGDRRYYPTTPTCLSEGDPVLNSTISTMGSGGVGGNRKNGGFVDRSRAEAATLGCRDGSPGPSRRTMDSRGPWRNTCTILSKAYYVCVKRWLTSLSTHPPRPVGSVSRPGVLSDRCRPHVLPWPSFPCPSGVTSPRFPAIGGPSQVPSFGDGSAVWKTDVLPRVKSHQ